MVTYQPGDIFVVRTEGFGSAVIRWATRGRVNHAGLIVSADGKTHEMVGGGMVEGRVRGTVITPRRRDGAAVSTAEREACVAVSHALMAAKVRYNKRGLVALFIAQRGGERLPWVRTQLQDNRNLFCSQHVDLSWSRARVQFFRDNRVPGNVSPMDINDLAQQRGWPMHPVDPSREHVGL
jgi:hypothetical protein